jgi:hypothetical protein
MRGLYVLGIDDRTDRGLIELYTISINGIDDDRSDPSDRGRIASTIHPIAVELTTIGSRSTSCAHWAPHSLS